MIHRRPLLTGLALLPFAPSYAQAGRRLTPEQFGAKGDGRTNDSAAFAQLSDAVNAAGGGTVVLRRTTYVVGSDGEVPARVLDFQRCTRAVRVEGNGARLRCRDGARYGARYGVLAGAKPTRQEARKAQTFRPYEAMIHATGCSGGIDVADVELDGNAGTLTILDRIGDKGWQLACAGVFLRENPGPETLRNVHTHDHPWDGLYIRGVEGGAAGVARTFTNVRCDRNGRQGMSITGGRGYRFIDCSFTRTGRGKIVSAPGAGVDLEPGRPRTVRNVTFLGCRFADNYGVGFLAEAGDVADVRLERCTLIGTTNYSAWPKKPGIVFDRCTLAGTVINTFGSPDPTRATRFVDCLISDDPKLSPTGAVYLRKNLSMDLGHAEGTALVRCRILLQHGGVLPWGGGIVMTDCTMVQRNQDQPPRTSGIFRGTNRIDAPTFPVKGSRNEGTLIFNGKTVPRS